MVGAPGVARLVTLG